MEQISKGEAESLFLILFTRIVIVLIMINWTANIQFLAVRGKSMRCDK